MLAVQRRNSACRVDYVRVDFASLASVQRLCDRIRGSAPAIALIPNDNEIENNCGSGSVATVDEALAESSRHRFVFDVVILNAGVLLPAERVTEDGLDASFQVNYLGQYMLVSAIIEHQISAVAATGGGGLAVVPPLKVVTLTSVLHR